MNINFSFKKLYILIFIICIIFFMNVVSASEIDVNNTLNNENSLDVSQSYLNSDFDDNLSSDDVAYEIYVDENVIEDGDGSKEKPYKTLDSVQSNYGDKTNNLTINLLDGTHYIGSELEFASSNLNIRAEGNNAILKNLNNVYGSKQTFKLVSNSPSFTLSNVIFDYSNWTEGYSDLSYFHPVICENSLVTFNDCSFIGLNGIDPLLYEFDDNNKYVFNRCIFKDAFNLDDIAYPFETDIVIFNYCIFSLDCDQIGFFDNEVYFNNSWFGQNSLPHYFFEINHGQIYSNMFHFTKYAVFNITESFLGDNKYEIIGKLTWNGTDNQEGIENFPLMTVKLNSTTGVLNQTSAILENGIFKVIYSSTSSNHNILAVLDNQKIDLQFTSMNMTLNAPSIIYGKDQNITVTLPNAVYGEVTVLVDGTPYFGNIENNNSIVIPITDTLSVGSHNVNVTFIDEQNHIYAFNTTTITVNKVSNYDFNATVTPSVYLGDNATVTLSLPDGATGNVSVKVGDNEAKTFNSDDIISIDGFVAGNNVVNITFTSDIYDAKSVVKTVVASAKPTTIATVNVTTTYNVAKDLVITLTDVNGKVLVNKTVNVVVGTINNNLTTNASGQVSIDVSTLAPNTYVANIAFAGDDLYAKSNATANVVINKIASSLTAPAVTATYNVVRNLVITLTANGKALANQKVTVKVGTISKTLTTNAKGQVSVDVSKLTPKTYTATFTYAGDDINDKSSNTAKVVVNKVKPKITAKKATFKAKKKTKKYSIVLKDNKGKAIKKAKVTLKVKGKTYKATTNAKGKATFKITKLTKKAKYTATIKFKGNANYKATTKKVKITIKK